MKWPSGPRRLDKKGTAFSRDQKQPILAESCVSAIYQSVQSSLLLSLVGGERAPEGCALGLRDGLELLRAGGVILCLEDSVSAFSHRMALQTRRAMCTFVLSLGLHPGSPHAETWRPRS